MKFDILKIANKKFKSRLIVGTGKYKNMKEYYATKPKLNIEFYRQSVLKLRLNNILLRLLQFCYYSATRSSRNKPNSATLLHFQRKTIKLQL